jgi:predicted DNA binding CopG/RHH family protein
MRPVQYFSDGYLKQCQKMSSTEIVQFLDDFRKLVVDKPSGPSRLISLKVPDIELQSFRKKCEHEGVKYQTQIKKLMRDWVEASKSLKGRQVRSRR